jgi:type I restriction enzyme S subunit
VTIARAEQSTNNVTVIDSNLPEGWAESVLENIIIHALGGEWGMAHTDGFQTDMVRVNVVRGTEFKNWDQKKGASAAERIIQKSSLIKRKLKVGDIVVEISGGGPDQPVGRTALIDGDAIKQAANPLICSNFCRQIRIHTTIDPIYINLALRYQYNRGWFDKYQTQTTNIRNLNFRDFITGVMIPIAPLLEQKRIAAKVEELLARVNATKERLAKVSMILKRFRQSALAAACSGRLTTDWRKDNMGPESGTDLLECIRADRERKITTNRGRRHGAQDEVDTLPKLPELWQWTTFEQIVEPGRPIIYGIIKPGPHDPKGVPYVRVFEMKDGRVGPLAVLRRSAPERASKFMRSVLKAGDLLISKDGTIGRVAVVPQELEGGNITQHLVRASVHPLLCRDYVVFAIRSQHSQNWLVGEKKGVALQGVNVEDFRRLPIPIPPLVEQTEIVRRVQALFKLADAIEKRVAAVSLHAEKLTQAILSKAFQGELVPNEAELARREGRSYETASELLARIKSARETIKTPTEGHKSRV